MNLSTLGTSFLLFSSDVPSMQFQTVLFFVLFFHHKHFHAVFECLEEKIASCYCLNKKDPAVLSEFIHFGKKWDCQISISSGMLCNTGVCNANNLMQCCTESLCLPQL